MSMLTKPRSSWVALLCCVVFSGCLEQSTVVKVKKDGSGVVHIRSHEQEVSITISAKKVNSDESESKLPSKERLQEMAEQMGEGVALKSAVETKNRSGWLGYELVFEFQDINHLVLDQALSNLTKSDAKAAEDDSKTSEKADADVQELRFTLQDGRLEIRNHGLDDGEADATTDQAKPNGAIDPFANRPAATNPSFSINDAAISTVYAKILADARIGLFVEIDGEIASTNAKHQKQNLITLVSLNIGELLDNPDATVKLRELEALKGSKLRRKRSQELADGLNGLDLDAQDPVFVQFK